MKLLIVLFAIIASSTIFAADSSSGCGLGYAVAPKQSLVSSYTRLTVNTTFSNTIAMTFGTSGCAKHSIVKNDAKGIHFAEANLDVLALEMARGNGEFVNSFAGVFGCQNSELFGSMVQEKYESVLPSANTSGVELYNNVKAEIRKNANLSSSCSLI
ncbi:MAG: DUF3015 domain-containing protein [Bdellovibrionales bacterium]|nr:DUF3015 domain-containing protein [Bdellovibrionales bacterium]